ncbi:FAD-dependent oxidoreductase, partial [bacterium]|nr:FAD-dependent oxidoreductase [bacterium]
MITLTINDQKIEVEEGATILEAAKALGINIPTLCYHKALSPYGACRLCIVELVWGDHQSQVVASCLYPAQEGLVIKTHSERVLTARRIIAELLLARCPDLKELQDMAKELGVTRSRLRPKNEDCTLCGLCVRMCQERMGIGAVGFAGRGSKREIVPAFNMPSDICQTCGACASICPTGRIKLEEITKNRPRPILSKFDEGLISIKPINILYPQAVPNWAAIDKEACVHLLKDKCGICEVVCDARAIDYTEKEEKIDLQVGSIILSPGYDTFSASLKNEYGFGRYKNVVSSIQFERILSASGPFAGHIQRLSDGKEPKRIAWIQCVGSRDFQVENPYCSSVCCTYAVKQAIIAKEHSKEKLETTIFYMDIRTFGKGFEEYYNRARDEYGVNFVKGRVSRVFENGKDGNLLVRFADEGGRIKTDEFGLVVLSVGLTPNEEVKKLARHLGIKLNEFGFAKTDIFSPIETTRPGVFVCGAFTGPKDIPETVMQGSASASKAGGLIAGARGSLITKKEYPPEIDVSGQGPRIGVFVCHCGINIGGVIDVPSVVEYARTLPNVVYAEHNLYTCSEDTQKKIVQMIKEHNLNRVIVASCTPRTHEPLFRETCRDAGLNPYLFEMANIRDQCSWVHMKEPGAATRKAKDLVRIAVAKSRILEPLYGKTLKVNHAGLVVGGGISGMRAALDLASSGFQVHLVEKEGELGGNLRRVHYLLDSTNPKEILQDMITRVNQSDKIKVYLNASLSKIDGFFGNFETSLNLNGEELQIKHGAVIIATGAQDYKPTEYLYGQDGRVLTQLELEERLAEVRNQKTEVRNQKTEVRNQKTEVRNQKTEDRGQRSENENLLNLSSDICHLSSVVMIQCVGSREEGRPYCSRLCCQHAIKNALRIKDISPQTNIYILYRDIRSYGFKELFYEEARRKGIIFIRYNEDEKPVVRNQKTEDRGQKTEDRGQKTEDRGQKTED